MPPRREKSTSRQSRSKKLTVFVEIVRAFRSDYLPETIHLEVKLPNGDRVEKNLTELRDWLKAGKITANTRARVVGAERSHLIRKHRVPNPEQFQSFKEKVTKFLPIREFLARRYLILRDIVYPVSAYARRFAVIGIVIWLLITTIAFEINPSQAPDDLMPPRLLPLLLPVPFLPPLFFQAYMTDRLRKDDSSYTYGCFPLLLFMVLHGWLLPAYFILALMAIPGAIVGAIYGSLKQKVA